MRVSVIIPFYNAENTIWKALESVRNQTFIELLEIILVDDGSTDRSFEMVQNFARENSGLPIILKSQENKGVSAARNAGLKLASGDFLALLDADDEWLPVKIENQLKIFEKYPDYSFVSSLRTNQKVLFPYRLNSNNLAEITFDKLMVRNESQPSSVLYRRKIIDSGLFFDEKMRYAEDINYWLRISKDFKMCILGERLLFAGSGKRTFGVSGLSENLKEMEKGFQKNLKDMLTDKRIAVFQYCLYFVFYKMKYVFRLLRNFFYKSLKR